MLKLAAVIGSSRLRMASASRGMACRRLANGNVPRRVPPVQPAFAEIRAGATWYVITLRVLANAALLVMTLHASNARQPSIVVIYADDHAQHAIGCYGSAINSTPNIDASAIDEMRFTQSFVGNSTCGPSRATLLTGLHASSHGQIDNRGGFRQGLPTFASILQSNGYATAVIGKWHVSSPPAGFDHWAIKKGGYYNSEFETAIGTETSHGHVTDVITDRAIVWMNDRRQKPFAIWISHAAVHRTWTRPLRLLNKCSDQTIPEPATLFDDYRGKNPGAATAQMRIASDLFPAYDLKLPVTGGGVLDDAAASALDAMTPEQRSEWDSAFMPRNAAFQQSKLAGDELTRWKYQRYIKNYLRYIDALDESVGRITAFLKQSGIEDNTVVIYTSDQGFFLGEHGWYDKHWMYEQSFRTPLIVRWPSVTRPGSRCDELVQNSDIALTLLAIAEVVAPESMHGRSLEPPLRGEQPQDWRQAVYYHYQMREKASQTAHLVPRHYGVRTRSHKLIHFYDLDYWELYNLAVDTSESRNCYDDPDLATVRNELTRSLDGLRARFSSSRGSTVSD